MWARFSLGMALQHVRANFERIALSVLAVALGVALVVAVLLMNQAVLASFTETIDDLAGRSHLTVSAADDASFPEALVDVVGAVPGVKLAVPLVSSFAFPDDGSGRLLNVFGVDLTNDAHVRVYNRGDDTRDVIDDFVEFLSQPDSVVLSRDYSEENGLRVGDHLRLVTPHGVATFTVRGLLEPRGLARALGGRLVIIDIPAAQRAFLADGQVSQIDVVLTDPATVDAAEAQLYSILPAGMNVREPMARKAVVRKTVQGVQATLAAIAVLCVLAGFLICYSRLSAIFEARTWEVGLMRSVGLSRSAIALELLKEALILGLLGSVLGVPLGLLIASRALPFVEATVTATYRLPLFGTEPEVRMSAILLGAAVGIVATVLAGLYPSLRLARKQPVAALTMRGRALPLSSGPGRWYVVVGLLLAIPIVLAVQQRTEIAALGQVVTALIAIITCVVAPLFVSICSRLIGRLAPRPLSTSAHLAVEQIAQDPRGSGLAIATLGLGVGVVLFLGLFGGSFESTVVSLFSDSLRADLIVSSQLQQASYRSAAVGGELVRQIAAIPGVIAVSGEQSKDQQEGGTAVVLKSFDPSAFTTASLYRWPLQSGAAPDALERVAKGDAILITRAFAFQTQKGPGDSVRLVSPAGPRDFPVAGIATGQMENAVVLNRDVYQKLWNDDQVYLIHVAVDPRVGADPVRRAIEHAYGETYRIKVRTGPELVTHLKTEAHKAFVVFYVLDAIILTLILIAVGDTLATAVMQRTREFGLFRAVGLAKLAIAKIVLAEGVALAAFGVVLATACGFALAAFWIIVQVPAMLGWGFDLHVSVGFVATALALAVLLSAIGALIPSIRAARFSVAEALRQE